MDPVFKQWAENGYPGTKQWASMNRRDRLRDWDSEMAMEADAVGIATWTSEAGWL